MTEEKATGPSETSSPERRGFVRRVMARRPRFLPPEFHEHTRAARKETLLAVRSLIDARLERLERVREEPAPPKAQRIKVE